MTVEVSNFTTRLVAIESQSAAWEAIPAQMQHLNLMIGEWGDPSADATHTFLLVHGITANLQWWHLIAERMLAASDAPIRLIALDLRGRGESDKPEAPYSMASSIADMVGLLNALGITEPINYVGHSLGAHIGVYFASQHPERVRHLALLDGGTPLPSDVLDSIATALNRLGKVFPDYETYVHSIKTSGIFKEWYPLVEQAYRYDCHAVEGGISSKISKDSIDQEITNMDSFYARLDEFYPLIKAPTVIFRAPKPIAPQFKPFLSPEILAHVTEAIAGGCRVVEVPDTNHYTIMIETTDQMIDVLLHG